MSDSEEVWVRRNEAAKYLKSNKYICAKSADNQPIYDEMSSTTFDSLAEKCVRLLLI